PRMKLLRLFSAGAIVLVTAAGVVAQEYAPPPSQTPPEATLDALAAKLTKLGQALESLRRQSVRDPMLAEVEVYHKAATWIVRHNEFYDAAAGTWTLDVLDRGLLRASQAAQGESPWLHQRGQAVVR